VTITTIKEWIVEPITIRLVSTGKYSGVVRLVIQWPSREHIDYAMGLGEWLDTEFSRQAALYAMGIEYEQEVEEPEKNSS
jgi:hypothetical protein